MCKSMVLVIVTLIALAGAAIAGDEIVYGQEIGIGVSVPDGWIFDRESGRSQGLQGVLYPVGSTWESSPQMIYIHIVRLMPGESLGKFILADLETFAKSGPDIRTKKMPALLLAGGSKAEVWEFTGEEWGNFERSAYLSKDACVVLFVLSSKSREAYDQSLEAFAGLVTKSYFVKTAVAKGGEDKAAAAGQ